MTLLEVLYDLLLNFVEKYDTKRGIPRPVSHLDLTARQAAFRCLMTAAKMFWIALCGATAVGLMLVLCDYYDAKRDTRIILVCGGAVVLLFTTAKAKQRLLPYEREDPPVDQASPWANPSRLRSAGFAQDCTASRQRGEVRLGTLTTGDQLVLPAANTMRHIALFGPEGSGKSTAFIRSFLRDWVAHGSTIVLDPRGELFEQTAFLYKRPYRLDLVDPSRSDYWNFVPDCKGNHRLANEIASIIVASQPDGRRRPGSQGLRMETEAAALTAILLHLPHIVEQPTPPMIGEFISVRSIDPLHGETESPFDKEMKGSSDPQVGKYWTSFARADRYVQGAILSDLISKCRMFSSSTVKSVTSPLATPGAAPRAAIDLNMLHKPGTAIYLRILEGQVDLYSCFLTTFFQVALSVLSVPLSSVAEEAPVLFVFDDAGRVPIRSLKSILSLAPTSEVAIVLALERISQVFDCYGPHDGEIVLRSLKTMVFLPVLDERTIEVAASLASFNSIQHSGIDKRKKKSKGDRLERADVNIYEKELRQPDRRRSAIALVGYAPPIRFLRSPLIEAPPDKISRAANKGTPYVIDFPTAEAQYKSVGGKNSTGSRSNPRHNPELSQPENSLTK